MIFLNRLKGFLGYCKWVFHDYGYRRALKRKGVRLADTAYVKGNCHISSGSIDIGPGSIISGCHLDGRGGLTIGKNVILDQTTILTAQHDIDDPLFPTVYQPVEIGDYAVLFYRSIVLPGRKIGKGAVDAAGAVVSHDVPDMAIVAGNPARVIRYRKDVHTDCDLQLLGGLNLRRQSQKYIEKLFPKSKLE